MVVNLCLPHFHTTVHCNKTYRKNQCTIDRDWQRTEAEEKDLEMKQQRDKVLCADGYDVTNLVSADPALRRRGFKLEYFLRPPVQVTLEFGFQVELCRVDVELWPWGMDRGQACKRLEISTSSDRIPPQNFDQGHKQAEQKGKDPNKHNREIKQEDDGQSAQSNGHQWSRQAQQWGGEARAEPQRGGHVYKSQSNTESSHPEAEFKLVGRCELREETRVCFARSNCRPRAPFLSPPPPPPPEPAGCRQEELWSRGLLSLGAVTQLRVTLPFGGAASALGLKALAVWGQPARCCSAEEVERIRRIHEAGERKPPRPPAMFASSASQTKPQAATPPSSLSIPEEFLDPITQEVMMLPMLLPSGVSVDTSTLEEHQKTEATWGRPPNDPFTGVPFTSTSQPLPNPQLKTRIDHFLLQKGMIRKDGMVGRRGEGENPQASRLLDSKVDGQPLNSQFLSGSPLDSIVGTVNTNRTGLGRSTDNGNWTSNPEAPTTDCKSESERQKKRDLSGNFTDSADASTAEQQLLPQAKRPKISPGCSSHEQRLSASLDEALFSALQGRPSFTSNLTQQRRVPADSERRDPSQHCQTADNRSVQTGEKKCCACSCSVSAYSKNASSVYRLTCGHLLCRSCLRRDAQPPDAVALSTSNHISCPACQSPTPRSDITRVHH